MTEPDRLIAGRYRLIARLGSGGMGVVWQAHDERLHRTVAVKQLLMPSELTGEQAEQAKRLAIREGRIAAKLQHPHSIMVYDVTEDDGQPYLIMEYLPSRSLSHVLAQRGTLPPAEVAEIGSQAAAALASAHAAGVVHRDVKPGNVLLGDDGTVKITDFGISRAVEDITATITGFVLGTPAYLSPEVAKGGRATFSSDVFSLGATLYTAIEGVPPFGSSENAMAQLYRVASEEPRPPTRAGQLTDLLMRLLRTDPDQRPTMAKASEALSAVAAGSARPVPPPPQPTQPLPRPPRPEPPQSVPQPPLPVPQPPQPVPYSAQPVTRPAQPTIREDVAFPHIERDDATSSPESPPRSSRGWAPGWQRRRTALLVATAVALLVLAGWLLALALNNGVRGSGSAAAPPGTSPPASQTAPTASPTAKPSPTATPTTPTATPAAPENSPQALQAAITDYYALMPANVQEGWTRLTPRYQSNPGGGYDGYRDFWNQMSAVRVSDVQATQGTVVEATVEYTFTSGKVVRERHRYTLVSQDGRWKIDESSVLSSVTL